LKYRARAILLFIAAAFASRTATASDTSPSADDPVAHGIQMREEGRDEEALALFRLSFATSHEPRALAQMGLAEQALGRFVAAESDLKVALASEKDPWIEGNRPVLERALSITSSHLADIEIVSNIPGAELWINGARDGTLPLPPVRVEGGGMVLEVRARGYETLQRTVVVAAGARFREEMVLVPVLPSSSPPGSAARPRDAASINSARTVAWSLVAGGSALLAAGVAAQLVRETNAATYDDDALCFFGTITRDERCGRYRIAADHAQTLAIAAYLGAGAALGAAALLFLIDRHERPVRSALSCAVGPLMVACARSF
jgi:hypothetical protein